MSAGVEKAALPFQAAGSGFASARKYISPAMSREARAMYAFANVNGRAVAKTAGMVAGAGYGYATGDNHKIIRGIGFGVMGAQAGPGMFDLYKNRRLIAGAGRAFGSGFSKTWRG